MHNIAEMERREAELSGVSMVTFAIGILAGGLAHSNNLQDVISSIVQSVVTAAVVWSILTWRWTRKRARLMRENQDEADAEYARSLGRYHASIFLPGLHRWYEGLSEAERARLSCDM